ncbi:TIGR02587 family membrane protein [Phenylobacterium sp.]|uniref:TIGR02587 family membrane protein n=1 Tax=Phenylobacterium sp. TaxID=1871053 RepID=UPI0027312A16|nr:TIGR02587 family membrane protein [Phenylobacterium sp.]MDP1618659.1 TIGR02587 family membrane protein [Phenylobacterium sp.]MDP1987197.1 TIGR02587 family membrane protein [Phenylobacterium sp.]
MLGAFRADAAFLRGLGRAFAGALIFSLPMMMTMEMWWLGFYMNPLRLALLIVLTLPVLVGLSHFGGMRPTARLRDDMADALVVMLVAAIASTVILGIFGILTPDMSAREIIGKVAVQTVPGSFGAMLARSQLGDDPIGEDAEARDPDYWGELFLMGAGALFLSFNVAPTEEMVAIAYKMSAWQGVALAILSLGLMHAFVYALNFRGGSQRPEETPAWVVFLRFSVVGYAIVLLVSLFALWIFGRTDGGGMQEMISSTIVLGFPGAIGAAAARLLL